MTYKKNTISIFNLTLLTIKFQIKSNSGLKFNLKLIRSIEAPIHNVMVL